MRGRTKDYAWGSRTAIPELLGTAADGGRQAELWLGAHPSSPSVVELAEGRWEPLDGVIDADPTAMLGDRTVGAFGPALPFLLKVLAAEQPLSLQVHPNREQAASGFAREEAAGVPRDAPARNYRDPNHKPELVYALTAFDALCGFRPVDEAEDLLARVERAAGSVELLHAVLQDLRAGQAAGLRQATERILAAEPDRVEVALGSLAQAQDDLADASLATALELARLHPGDPGVILALLLNQVRLEPGQALYLPAGNLHAYLGGTAIEVMANSDNVLRAGLTSKHVDTAGVLEVLDLRVLSVPILQGTVLDDGDVEFCPPVEEFQLRLTRLEAGQAGRMLAAERVHVGLVLAGECQVDDATGVRTAHRGEAFLIPAAQGPASLRGSGRVVTATTGVR